MPYQPLPATVVVQGASPRTYYASIRREPDRVHPALRPQGPDRRTHADWEVGLAELAVSVAGLQREQSPFDHNNATAVRKQGVDSGRHFDSARAARHPYSIVAPKTRCDSTGTTLPSSRQHQKDNRRPLCLYKPLPPLPSDLPSISLLTPERKPSKAFCYCRGETSPSRHKHKHERSPTYLDKPLPPLPCDAPTVSLLILEREPSKARCYLASRTSPSIYQHQRERIPLDLDKPLPPLPCNEPAVVLSIKAEWEPGRWCTGPDRSGPRVEGLRLRPDSVALEYGYDTSSEGSLICESPVLVEQEEEEEKHEISGSVLVRRRYTV